MKIWHQVEQVVLLLTFCIVVSAAESPSIELVSKPYELRPRSFGDSGELQLSQNGKWAVFTSTGNGIVTNDNNGFILDVFLRNNETGETVRLTGDNENIEANGDSYYLRMSPDGRFIVFQSDADNLVDGDENEDSDAFLYTRELDSSEGGLILLSVDADGNQLEGVSGAPVGSADGQIFLIETDAAGSELDTNDSVDLYQISPGKFELVSTRSNSLAAADVAFPSSVLGNFQASMSADGRFVVFISSGTNHVAGVPSNAGPQVYLRDMVAQTNAWLSCATNGTAATMVDSPVITTNGETVFFLSSPLPAAAGASSPVLYQYAVASGTLSRVLDAGSVDEFALSENGRLVALASSNRVYLHDLSAATNTLVSRRADGGAASGVSGEPVISADGKMVVFTSSATNLVEGVTEELSQTYRFDRETGEVVLLSRAFGGKIAANADTLFPTLSGDGSVAGFVGIASNVSTNDDPRGNDIFITSTSGTNEVVLVSAPNPEAISATPAGPSVIDAHSISADGRIVVFSSEAPDIVREDTNTVRDIFVRDLETGTTEWISRNWYGPAHAEASTFVGASLDGNMIAYLSGNRVGDRIERGAYARNRAPAYMSNFVASVLPDGSVTTNVAVAVMGPSGRYLAFRQIAGTGPVYVRDLILQSTVQVPAPAIAATAMDPYAISPSGRYLLTRNNNSTFALHDLTGPSHVTNITSFGMIAQPFTLDDSAVLVTASAATINARPLVLWSLNGGTHVSIATNATPLAMSLDGSKVAYQKTENGVRVVYFYDRATQTSSPLMFDGTNANVRVSGSPAFSIDGRFFAFLATNDFGHAVSHSFNKLFVYDTLLKTIRLASRNALGEAAELGTGSPSISLNGRTVVFESPAANLIPGDRNLSADVFVTRLAPEDSDADGVEDGWERIYFGGTASTAEGDPDSDGLSNLQEYLAGSDPENAESRFEMETVVHHEGNSLILEVPASPGMSYQMEYRSRFSEDSAWEPISETKVAMTTTVSFRVPLGSDSNQFYRISAIR